MTRTQTFKTLLAAAILVCAKAASAQSLAPFKDELFSYPAVLSETDGGAYQVVDYNEMRDVNGRDEIPEKRVKKDYVALGVRSQQKELRLQSGSGALRFVAVGKQEGASMIVLYLHGQGGSRAQGVNDYTFGGNFNRVKNLVVQAGGLYVSPDFSTFGDKGLAQVSAIINHYAEVSPGARVFVACGSMGGALCWKLAGDVQMSKKLGGLLLLGSLWSDDFLTSPAFKAKVPVFIGHGSRDTVFPIAAMEAFYKKIRAKSKSYPIRFVRFESGIHGTPIRMTDWREALNRMLR